MIDTHQQTGGAQPVEIPQEIKTAPPISGPGAAPGELVATTHVPLNAAHGEFAEFHEGYVSRYIELADTKSAWAFAIAAGVIAFILGNDTLQKTLFRPAWDAPFILATTTVGLLVISAVFSFLVIKPRLGAGGEDIVYFGSVAKRRTADDYVRDVAGRSEAELTEARLKHAYDISRICTRKFALLEKSIYVGVTALFGLAGMLLVN